MVLISPIITALISIAVVLMALLVLGVSGICQPPGRTGQRPDTGTVTS